MEVVVVDSPAEGGRLVADAIDLLLDRREHPVVGLATGGTPQPVYEELIRRRTAAAARLANLRLCQLDEYVALPDRHPASYRQVLRTEVLAPLGLGDDALLSPDGTATDLRAECTAYEQRLDDLGGVDLQLLGIGSDGHIGFNEPTSSLASRTRVKTLTAQTRKDNARFFDDDPDAVPHHVLTQGIGTILRARHLVLLAWGTGKAEAVAAAVEGPLAAMNPASALQLHPHATVIVDAAAAGRLRLLEYYRSTWQNRPDWQEL